jgi:trimeric autotransporter adhesin
MIRSSLLLVITILFTFQNYGQVAINTDGSQPNGAAMLDISSSTKGLLTPRMTTAQRLSLASTAVEGLLVYDTDLQAFFVYRGGTINSWEMQLTASLGWATAGNAGTDPATNFLGTSDNKDLVFKINSQNAGRLSQGTTIFGYQAGNVNASGHSTFLGMWAGKANTSGDDNIAIGYEAMLANTTGLKNIAIGSLALGNNTKGQNNIAIGYSALLTQSYSPAANWDAFNVAIGNGSMQNTQSSTGLNGSQNTAVGHEAMNANTSGTGNTAVGYRALFGSTTAQRNCAFGYQALYSASFSGNSAFGYQALYSNTTASGNTAMGDRALYTNGAGPYNVAIGAQALYLNDNGGYNTALGYNSMKNNTGGTNNSAVGYWSLYNNQTGAGNNAYGYMAMSNNQNGSYNNAFGYQAMSQSTSGTYNNAFGNECLQQNSNGSYNVAMGYRALLTNSTGGSNTAIGSYAGNLNLSGSRNTILGDSAGYWNSTGNKNVFLGYQAGMNETGSNRLYIDNSGSAANGSLIYGEFDNHILATNGKLGVGTTAPASALSVGTNSEFQVNSTGDIAKLNNVTTSFPSSQGAANSFLRNDGSGNLTWSGSLPGTGNVTMTATGGMAILLTNSSGSSLSKGTVVQAGSTDLSFIAAAANSEYAIGVLSADCANGAQGWVVVSGVAEVLIKDGTTATAGYWAGVSDTEGRAYMTTSGPPGVSNHDKEIGHCLQTVSSGTNVLVKAVLHFR